MNYQLLLVGLILFSGECASNTSSTTPVSSSTTSPTTSSSFYKGVDLSYINELEDVGVKYYDENNVQKDPFVLFKEKGANCVRVRLWHTPKTKYSGFDDVKKTISRAKQSGMAVLLDFHYSDFWADPGNQIIPAAWLASYNNDKVVADSMYNYTYKALKKLNDANLLPDLVQVGNETNTEILKTKSYAEDNSSINWARNAMMFNAAIKAVRTVSADLKKTIKIVLHIADPVNVNWWFGKAKENSITDFDIIGVSFYPIMHSKTNVSDIGSFIKNVRNVYNKDVMIVETGTPWTSENNNDMANILNSNPPTGYTGSPSPVLQNQIVADIVSQIKIGGGIGLFYWEPAWVSSALKTTWGVGSSYENATFFDFKNKIISTGAVQFLSK